MKRKLAALITLIAFAVTMIPSMAFAEDPTTPTTTTVQAVADTSVFATVDKNSDNNNVKKNKTVDAKITFYGNDGETKATAFDKLKTPIYLWATKSGAKDPSSAVTMTGEGVKAATDDQIANTYVVTDPVQDMDVTLAFAQDGTYTIHAGVLLNKVDNPTVADLTNFDVDENYNTIVVKADSTDADQILATKYDGNALNDGKGIVLAESSKDAKIINEKTLKANGVATKEVEVQVLTEDGKVVKNKDVTVKAMKSGLTIDQEDEQTDRNGKVTFKVTADKAGEYKVEINCDGYKAYLKINAGDLNASKIENTAAPSNPMDRDTLLDGENDDIQFEIRDSSNVLLSGDEVSDEPAMSDDADVREDYVKIVSQPEDSDLDDGDFQLVPVAGEDYYTLKLDTDAAGETKLDEGTYTVKVSLDNGDAATVTWKVAKFGTEKALKMSFKADTVELGAQMVHPKKIKVVDENGVERDIEASDDLTFGYNGYAIENFAAYDQFDAKGFHFNVKNDEKYLGQTVHFTAVSDKLGLSATADVVIAEDGQSLTFDSTNGSVDEDNTVKVQVVDGAGKTVAPGTGKNDEDSEIYAYIVEGTQSNPDAVIAVDTDDTKISDLNDKGLGKLTLTSDKEGSVDVQVYVKGGNGKMYANTLTYTFGAAPSGADLNVVMTIDSPETIVNNKIVTIDAAPYVNADYRTMVPIRALAEDFGATVDWNADTQTVTVKLDGNTVEMTIGSTTYKVNGTEKTMDTAPVINDGRTFVPVRFVAEALGFKVTPTYNADGTTASVVFAR